MDQLGLIRLQTSCGQGQMGYEPRCSKRAAQEAGIKSRGAKTCKCLAAGGEREAGRPWRRSGMVLFDWSLDENDLTCSQTMGMKT